MRQLFGMLAVFLALSGGSLFAQAPGSGPTAVILSGASGATAVIASGGSGGSAPNITAPPGFFVGCYGPNLPPIQSSGFAFTAARTIDEVYVCEMWLPFGMQVGHINTNVVATTAATTYNVGLWNSAGTKVVDSGPLPCTIGNQISTLGTTTGSSSSVLLPAGVYYFGWSTTNTACEVLGINPYGTDTPLMNVTTNKYYPLITLSSGAPMQLPTALGSAGATYNGQQEAFALFEP